MQLPSSFFCKNRDNLCKRLAQDSLALIPSGIEVLRFARMAHPFHVNPSFFYFCGICEPDLLLLLDPHAEHKKTILFIPQSSKKKEQWDGKIIDKKEAKAMSGVDEIEYLENFPAIFQAKQNWKTKLYVENNTLQEKGVLEGFFEVLKKIRRKNPALEIKKLDFEIAALRAKKQPLEIQAIEKAIAITHQALLKIWNKAPTAHNEKQLEAELTYQYQSLGAEHAFSPIIASGANAITLHYTKNSAPLEKKELLLTDTGASWQGYNADITRVIPVAKKFSEKQKKYYELVLQMQQAVVEVVKPKMTWWELYKKADKIQGSILKKAGIISKEKEHKLLTIHNIGHSLGVEVHDICNHSDTLEVGTVLTIEPGLYLPEEAIGIRIEDDFLITGQGIKNLSEKIPKTIKEVENIFL
jgi:Xaa-Pro aminopeptidase